MFHHLHFNKFLSDIDIHSCTHNFKHHIYIFVYIYPLSIDKFLPALMVSSLQYSGVKSEVSASGETDISFPADTFNQYILPPEKIPPELSAQYLQLHSK